MKRSGRKQGAKYDGLHMHSGYIFAAVHPLSFPVMKAFVSLFLVSLFLVQTFSSFVLDGTYWFNRAYVSQNLCINRGKPFLHCGGKCFLSKQIGKENRSDASANGKKEREQTAYFFPAYPSTTGALPPAQRSFPDVVNTGLLPAHGSTLLRPPGSFSA